jgi:Fic family protein
MQVVSGAMGHERAHYEAPAAARLPAEMDRSLHWFNRAIDIHPVFKAAIAHLWLVTIHPFDDGNGRIARAISDIAACPLGRQLAALLQHVGANPAGAKCLLRDP